MHQRRHQALPDVDASERARVLAELAAGRSLADVLDGEAAFIGSVPVRDVLEALPGVDRIHPGQLLRLLHIGKRCTVAQLADLQRQRLRQLFPPATAA
jgi:hypothetical protein